MPRRFALAIIMGLVVFASMPARGQISFPKTTYYVAMGDSFAAGTGAMPVTNGYAYQLYHQGVFGRLQEVKFANVSLPGARSFDVRDHQVPQVLCAKSHPTVVTLTAGAIDFKRGDQNIPAIAGRLADGVNLLLNNDSGLVPVPVLDPVTGVVCPALSNATIMVSNYPSMPHPDPANAALLDAVMRAVSQTLLAALSTINVPAGSRVVYVDLYSASLGRTGLILLERRLGVFGPGPFDFDAHPTNLGHRFIAGEFERAWNQLQ